ncbi:MAG: hypothetical protein ACRDV7_09275, partial [Acidimicrobiia bacterium]
MIALVQEGRAELRGAVSDADVQFREKLRAWLAEHPPPAVDIATTVDDAEVLRVWHRTMHAGGWIGILCPVEH